MDCAGCLSESEDIFYYLSLYNENYAHAANARRRRGRHSERACINSRPVAEGKKIKAHIFGSGPIINSALRAQEILAERYDVSADVWSATSYKLLRTDAIRCQRWNMLHPTEPPKKSYVETLLAKEQGAFVAVSDNIRTVPDQIAPWVPGGLFTLGTDGFGRSDTRDAACGDFLKWTRRAPSSPPSTLWRRKISSDAKWWRKPSRTSASIRKKFIRNWCRRSVVAPAFGQKLPRTPQK